MKRILIVLVVVALLAGVPPVREAAAPFLAPVWERVVGLGQDLIHPFLMPIQRYHARSDLEDISINFRSLYNSGRPFPHPRRFHQYVKERRLTDTGGLDPWGSAYQYVIRRDSVIFYSIGPDLEFDTEDDVEVAFVIPSRPRSRTRR